MATIPALNRSAAIALQLLTERALNREDQRLYQLITKRVGWLRLQREEGIVRTEQGPRAVGALANMTFRLMLAIIQH
jgi:hypothetical protein